MLYMFSKGIDLTIKAKDGTAIEPVKGTRNKEAGTKKIEGGLWMLQRQD